MKLPPVTWPVCALVALSFAAPLWGDEALPLKNPGFEENLDHWAVAKNDNGMSEASPDAAHAGKAGLRVTDGDMSHGSSAASDKFDVKPGASYEVRFWGRCISGDGINVYLQFTDPDGKKLTDIDDAGKSNVSRNAIRKAVPKTASEWQQFSFTGVAPEGAASVYIWIHSANNGMTVADVDDFELLKVK